MNRAAAAVVLGLTTSACAAPQPTIGLVSGTRTGGTAGPTVLADLQMDSVTAAGVLVEVSSFATAIGDGAHTRTDANTFVFGGKYLDLGVGITRGRAAACCGEDADVEVASAVLGIGDIVHGVVHGVERDGPLLAYGLSVGLVVAVSFEKYRAMLEELPAVLSAARIQLSDASIVGEL